MLELGNWKPLNDPPSISLVYIKRKIFKQTKWEAEKVKYFEQNQIEQQGQRKDTWLFPGQVDKVNGKIGVTTTTPASLN